MAYIYIVRCEDRSLYTGIAKNLGRRMREHYYRKKAGAKYTKSRQIQSLEMVWETEEWSHAAKLEFRIKQLSRIGKENLIRNPWEVERIFPEVPEGARYCPHPELTLSMFLESEEGKKVLEN